MKDTDERKHALAAQLRLFPVASTFHPTLPEICLHVRASINGSADAWPDDQLEEVYEMLRARLDTWTESRDQIDHAIAHMVRCACAYIKRELDSRAKAEDVEMMRKLASGTHPPNPPDGQRLVYSLMSLPYETQRQIAATMKLVPLPQAFTTDTDFRVFFLRRVTAATQLPLLRELVEQAIRDKRDSK